ncbi:hypothetical protein [Actinoallomurus soli]|uniref:hypothetical protein n=1 Tax=Actinoallomurus soli TaxID=2952535 RepID=UPI0020921D8D|nr:hypothetical protein [Actinoallomurus soli]MCO5967948.1 hypothetical protein [Actinoallomurus soli]
MADMPKSVSHEFWSAGLTANRSTAVGEPGHVDGRRSRWIALVGVLMAGVLVSCSNGSPRHKASPASTPAGLKTTGAALPLKATHDAHGLIVALPDLVGVLGRAPLPGVTLSGVQTYSEILGGSRVTKEEGIAFTRTSSRYKALNVNLLRWPSVGSVGESYGKVGPGPFRENAHHWYGASIPIADLGDTAIVFQTSDGPISEGVADRTVSFDTVGATLKARYKNVAIDISLNGASFGKPTGGRVSVSHESYGQTKADIIKMAKKIIDHL